VGGSGATIQGLSPGNTVVVGNPVTFTVAASGFTNPVFTAQDSFSGSSASNSNLNSGGYFSWTPNSNDVGTHNFTIYVNDSSGHTGNVTVSVAVQTPTIAITSINPGSVITPNTVFTFNVTPSGFTNPSYTVADSFSGTSITNSNLNSSGYFNWTPASNQIGSHTITVYATDSAGHSANTSYTVNVNSGVSVSVSLPSPSTYIAPGSGVSFQAYPYGFYTPTYSIQDSFGGTSISSSNINNSGAFYWTPNASDVGTHTLTITANDSYGHTATTQTTITVSTTGTVGTNNQTLIASLRAQLAQLLSQIAAIQQGQGTTSSSTGARHIFSTFLTVGSHGSEVSALQQYLTSLGLYSGPINGSYGQLTRRGVMLFQSRHGIKQAGYVGPSTRDALNQ
jgi:Flp pilus assembly protein TadG